MTLSVGKMNNPLTKEFLLVALKKAITLVLPFNFRRYALTSCIKYKIIMHIPIMMRSPHNIRTRSPSRILGQLVYIMQTLTVSLSRCQITLRQYLPKLRLVTPIPISELTLYEIMSIILHFNNAKEAIAHYN